MKDSSDGAEERILTLLKSWSKQLQWPAEAEQGTWIGSAENVEECNEKTEKFSKENLWPFVKVTRYIITSLQRVTSY